MLREVHGGSTPLPYTVLFPINFRHRSGVKRHLGSSPNERCKKRIGQTDRQTENTIAIPVPHAKACVLGNNCLCSVYSLLAVCMVSCTHRMKCKKMQVMQVMGEMQDIQNIK